MRTIINWINRERPARQFPLSDFDRLSRVLTPCDVILVEGRTRVSDIIRWLTNSPWTHAALFIGRIDDIQDDALRVHYRFMIANTFASADHLDCPSVMLLTSLGPPLATSGWITMSDRFLIWLGFFSPGSCSLGNGLQRCFSSGRGNLKKPCVRP